MFKRTNFSGYLVENRSEVLSELAARGFAPMFSRKIFEHITYQYPDMNSAPDISTAQIVAHYNHDAGTDGVQAVLVEIDGSSVRPDGKLYHITYTLSSTRKPFESNKLISDGTNRVDIDPPISLRLKAF